MPSRISRRPSSKDFENDRKTVFAAVRAIEIISEAAKRIPDSIKNEFPEIPWKDMAGMRDKVIHEYFGVDLSRLGDGDQPHSANQVSDARVLREAEG